MGQICSSSQQHDADSQINTFSATDLDKALTVVGGHLQKKRTKLVIVAVGGVINTLYLRSRETTHDVDFFSRTLEYEELQLLTEATIQAASAIGAVSTQWLNNQTSVFMTQPTRLRLVEGAISNNEVIFRAGGITVLAPPWRYAISIEFISPPPILRNLERTDAVQYLHRLTQKTGNSVSHTDILTWLDEFQLSGADIIPKLGQIYLETFGTVGVEI